MIPFRLLLSLGFLLTFAGHALAALTLPQAGYVFTTLRNAPARDVTIQLTDTAAGNNTPWTAAFTTPVTWATISPASGTGSRTITVRVTPGANSQSTVLRFTGGGFTAEAFVGASVTEPVFSKMVLHPTQPVLCALMESNTPRCWAFYNSTTLALRKIVDISGFGNHDMTVHPSDGRFYLQYMVSGSPNIAQIRAFEPGTLNEVQTMTAPWLTGITAAGPGRLIFTGYDALTLRSIAAGSPELSRVVRSSSSRPYYDRARSLYYDFEVPTSFLTLRRYRLTGDGFTQLSALNTGLSLNPSLVTATADGSHLFMDRQRFVVTDNAVTPDAVTPEPIHVATARARMLSGTTKVWNGVTGAEIATHPFSTSVQALSADGQWLYLHNRSTGALVRTAVSSLMPPAAAPATGTPAAAATVLAGAARDLTWALVPAAVRYRVYFGTDAAAVAAATAGSPLQLGTTTDATTLPMPALTPGTVYHWRVDVEDFDGAVIPGAVWSFTASPLVAQPAPVEVTVVKGAANAVVDVSLTSAAPLNWTATESLAWAGLMTSSGTTPGTLRLAVSPGALTEDTYTGMVNLTAGGTTVELPVSLTVAPLNPQRLVNDPARPSRIYLLNGGLVPAISPGQVVLMDPATATMGRTIAVGTGPAAISMSPDGSALYVLCSDPAPTPPVNTAYRIDPVTFEVSTRRLASYTGVQPQLMSLAAANGGRLYWTDGRPDAKLHTVDFNTGATLLPDFPPAGVTPSFAGRVVLAADGSALFSASSTVGMIQVGASALTWRSLGNQASGIDISALPFLSRDGQRAFAGESEYHTADMTKLLRLHPGRDIDAITSGGEIMFDFYGAYRTRTRRQVFTLEGAALSAVTSDDARLLYYTRQGTPRFISVPMSSIGEVPGPFPEDGEVVDSLPSPFSWPAAAGSLRYEFYFGEDRTAVTAATTASPLYLGSSDAPEHAPPVAGKVAWCYYWRVDTVTATGTVKGRTWQVLTRAPQVATSSTQKEFSSSGYEDAVACDGNDAVWGAVRWSPTPGGLVFLSRTPVSDEWTITQKFQAAGSTALLMSVAMGEGRVAAGAPAEQAVYILARNPSTGRWEQERKLTNATAGEQFGYTVAISGGLLAVGAPNATRSGVFNSGAVDIFDLRTGVRITRLQTSNAASNAFMGMRLAWSGEWLAAGGSGYIYMWRRSTAGAWTFNVRLAVPTSQDSTLALDGTLLAACYFTSASPELGKVDLYRFGTAWTKVHTLGETTEGFGTRYGTNVSLKDGLLAVGEMQFNDAESQDLYSSGRIHLYRRGASDTAWHVLAPIRASKDGFTSTDYARAFGIGGPYLMASSQGTSSTSWFKTFKVNSDKAWPPRFTSRPEIYAAAGAPYEYRGAAVPGRFGHTLTFSKAAGPAWLNVTSDGVNGFRLSGTAPAATGAVTVEVAATGADGQRSVQVFTLTIVPADAIPDIERIAGPAAPVPDGSPVTLRVNVAGAGPFTYQWYFRGTLLTGVTGPSLELPRAQAADSGLYSVLVTGAQASAWSEEFQLTVTANSDRFAGDWSTLGRDAARTGYYPATFGTHVWQPKWETALADGVTQAVIAGHSVFATQGVIQNSNFAWALNLRTGARLWTHTFDRAFSLSPATVHRGRLYIQRSNNSVGTGTNLWCLNAATGSLVWSAPFSSQWEEFGAPAVNDSGLWMQGGGYGGLYHFDLNGAQVYFNDTLGQDDGWTPAVDGSQLCTGNRGFLRAFRANDGSEQMSINTGSNDSTTATNVSIADSIAVISHRLNVTAANLQTGRELWRRSLTALSFAPPARRAGMVYVPLAKEVRSFSADDGDPGPVFATGIPAAAGESLLAAPIVTDDLLIASSAARTFIFRLTDGALMTTLPKGGIPSYANGWLTLAGSGRIAAYYANGQPEFDGLPAEISVDEDTPLTLPVSVTDADGDTVALTAAPLPAWLALNGLTLAGTPGNDDTGEFQLTLSASDSVVPQPATRTLRVRVNPVNDPPVFTAEALAIETQEDASPPALLLTSALLSDVDDAPENVTLTVTANSHPQLVTPSVAGHSVGFALAPDANGQARLTLTATDAAGLTDTMELVLNVAPVNDAPSWPEIVVILDQLEDAAPAWRSSTPPHDVDDAPAALTLSVTEESFPALLHFRDAPGINPPDRALEVSFHPPANFDGTATATLRVADAAGLFADRTYILNIIPQPDPPAALPLPPVATGPAGQPLRVDTAAGFADPDTGDVLTYTIAGNTNPALFASLSLDSQTGILDAVFALYVAGSADITIRATGSDGLFTDNIVTLTLPALPPPALTTATTTGLNRQTGLLEWRITVTNAAQRPIGGFELDIAALPAGAVLYNASGHRPGGTPFVRYGQPLAPGAAVTLMLEFHHPARSTAGLPPALTGSTILPQPDPPAGAAGAAFQIDRVVPLPGGGLLLEFPSIPGDAYQIEYTTPGGDWLQSPVRLHAAGTRTQWLDRGPPYTVAAPPSAPSRMYRVRRL